MEDVEHVQKFYHFMTSGFIVLHAMHLMEVDDLAKFPGDCDLDDLASRVVRGIKPEIDQDSINAIANDDTDDGHDDAVERRVCICQVEDDGSKKSVNAHNVSVLYTYISCYKNVSLRCSR